MSENTGEQPQNSGRRNFLTFITKGAIALGAAAIDRKILSSNPKEQPEVIIALADDKDTTQDTQQSAKGEVKLQEQQFTDSLNTILSTPLDSDSDPVKPRTQQEREVVQQVNSITEVDQAFEVIVDPASRAKLLDKRYEFRKTALELHQLSLQEESWASSKNIHPEVLAICIDAYNAVRPIIDSDKNNLRGEHNTQLTVDDMMITAGGMAELIVRETGYNPSGKQLLYGFCNIGKHSALSQINSSPDAFPNDPVALAKLAQRISADTGLQYDVNNMPGSDRGDPKINLSGGAIGLQFMPSMALREYDELAKFNVKMDPWDPVTSVMAGYIFLARQEQFSTGLRYGFDRTSETAMKNAIVKWNPEDNEDSAIYQAHMQYWSTISSQQFGSTQK